MCFLFLLIINYRKVHSRPATYNSRIKSNNFQFFLHPLIFALLTTKKVVAVALISFRENNMLLLSGPCCSLPQRNINEIYFEVAKQHGTFTSAVNKYKVRLSLISL